MRHCPSRGGKREGLKTPSHVSRNCTFRGTPRRQPWQPSLLFGALEQTLSNLAPLDRTLQTERSGADSHGLLMDGWVPQEVPEWASTTRSARLLAHLFFRGITIYLYIRPRAARSERIIASALARNLCTRPSPQDSPTKTRKPGGQATARRPPPAARLYGTLLRAGRAPVCTSVCRFPRERMYAG